MRQNLNRSDLFNQWRGRMAYALRCAPQFALCAIFTNAAGMSALCGRFFVDNPRPANDNGAGA